MKNIEARERPSMAEAETYWKSLWGEEAQHNERAEWIRKEQKRKVSHMNWMQYRLRKLLHICLKFTIGNLLEMIEYKVTGLKFPRYSQAYYKKPQCNNRGTRDGT